MIANRITGTLRFYGTPAEEGGSGKVYMVRDGLFTSVDWNAGRRWKLGGPKSDVGWAEAEADPPVACFAPFHAEGRASESSSGFPHSVALSRRGIFSEYLLSFETRFARTSG